MRKTLGFAILLLAATLGATAQERPAPLGDKKLIEVGWDRPTPTYLRDHWKTMEALPFDGVGIQIPEIAGGGNIFWLERWQKSTEADRVNQERILRELPRSATLTDNFLLLYGASTIDWFRDEDWKQVETHLRYCAKMAKTAGLKGVIWDGEPYGATNPWRYQEQPGKEKHSFSDYARQVRKRGGQFIRILQEEFPGIVVLSLRQLSDFQQGSPFSAKLLPLRGAQANRSAIERELTGAWWGLHVPFTDGILDGLAPTTTFIDANEDAYFYTKAQEFFRVYHTLKAEAQALVSPENRAKFRQQYDVGQALAADYIAGKWAGRLGGFPDWQSGLATELTPVQRAQWFEHNVYYSLVTSDKYAWCWSEDQNWWERKNLPVGFEDAIRSAKRKYQMGEPLGFEIESVLDTAATRLKTSGKKFPKPVKP